MAGLDVSGETAYRCCELCEHRCAVNRLGKRAGRCHADAVPRVFQYGVEYGEERELLPCQVVYLSGCDLRCAFCISGRESFDSAIGRPLTDQLFKQIVRTAREAGARTLQFSGGEPSIHAPALLPLIEGSPLPVVWKTALHETIETLELLLPHVAAFVADLKFGNDGCALRLAQVPRYVATAQRNLRFLAQRSRLIVRHLVLPNHINCCARPLLKWLAEQCPAIPLSLRDGYVPAWRASSHHDIAAPMSLAAMSEVKQLARSLNLNLIT